MCMFTLVLQLHLYENRFLLILFGKEVFLHEIIIFSFLRLCTQNFQSFTKFENISKKYGSYIVKKKMNILFRLCQSSLSTAKSAFEFLYNFRDGRQSFFRVPVQGHYNQTMFVEMFLEIVWNG